jgi:hypothetical protein
VPFNLGLKRAHKRGAVPPDRAVQFGSKMVAAGLDAKSGRCDPEASLLFEVEAARLKEGQSFPLAEAKRAFSTLKYL